MNEILCFLNNLLKELQIEQLDNINIVQARKIVKELNEFLYTNYDGIGETIGIDGLSEYISDYHKFWEKNSEAILAPSINEEKCEMIAEIFHEIYIKNRDVFYSLYSKEGLKDEEVCKIRFYTATQDFYGAMPLKKFADIYKNDSSIFDKEYIYQKPDEFIKELNIINLSQSDKRMSYAQKSAKLLIDFGCEPYDLLAKFNYNIEDIRNLLVKNQGMGFGNKKADMFIRDMIVLGIWRNVKKFDILDVASDRNTMKVALRTGILKTEIPLVSSFLDIFSYQYGIIDEWCAKAWRRVWEIWKKKHSDECIEGPSLIDYLIYRIIGREFCNEKLCVFEGNGCNHVFKWHSSQNKKCQVCAQQKIYNTAKLKYKVLPCQDEDGKIYISKNKYVTGDEAVLYGIEECPLKKVCNSEKNNFVKYNGPKSISILGRTGWDSARVRKGEGGGGLMA